VGSVPTDDDQQASIGWELAAWGKVVLLETRGRRTGRPRTAPVGFVEQPDGSLLIAAGDDYTDWARNLLAAPDCRATREGRTVSYRAQPLDGADLHAAVTALILRYGTPAERLGAGPAFRLLPLGSDAPGAGVVHSATNDTANAGASRCAGHEGAIRLTSHEPWTEPRGVGRDPRRTRDI
jgi:deazaflavin-dependent oxidoreductase (nitroreductase family)